AAALATAGDREAAQWVIRQGGRVMVNGGEPIDDIAKLPPGDIRVTGVDLFGAPASPKDLEHLSGLTELRELYIYSRTYSPSSDVKAPFSDESFQYLANLKKLEKFWVSLHDLPDIDIADAGWARMKNMTQLKDLRLALTKIQKAETLAPFVNLK